MSRLPHVWILAHAIKREVRFDDPRRREGRACGHPCHGAALTGTTAGCRLVCRLLQASPIHLNDPQ